MNYEFSVPQEFVDAIYWHGYRYELSKYLQDHIILHDEDNQIYYLEFDEPEAWRFKEILEKEGPLACGSLELNLWIQDVADQII